MTAGWTAASTAFKAASPTGSPDLSGASAIPMRAGSRIPVGILFIVGGLVGFLPILGFWMVPLGLLLLALDIPFLRRPTAAFMIWAERRWSEWRRKRRQKPSRMMVPGWFFPCNFNTPAVPLTGLDRAVNPLRTNRRRHAQDGRMPSIKVLNRKEAAR